MRHRSLPIEGSSRQPPHESPLRHRRHHHRQAIPPSRGVQCCWGQESDHRHASWNSRESRRLTLAQRESLGIRNQGLHLLEEGPEARNRCPHPDLDWYQKYLWQKVESCLREKIDVIFEDDQKVIALFLRFAPKILVMQVLRTARCDEV